VGGAQVVAAEQDEDGHERDSQCDRADEAGIALLGDDALGANMSDADVLDGLLEGTGVLLQRRGRGWDEQLERRRGGGTAKSTLAALDTLRLITVRVSGGGTRSGTSSSCSTDLSA